MDLKDRMMSKMIPDDALDAVTGGADNYSQRSAWSVACSSYVCQMCGSTSIYLNGHGPLCTVSGIGRPAHTYASDSSAEGTNGCWTCKHAVFGAGYPRNEDDVWCTIK